MSSNDKTRQKLVESMRKTKAGTGKETAASRPEQKSKTTGAVDKVEHVPSRKKAVNSTSQTNADPYQSRTRRVWPD